MNWCHLGEIESGKFQMQLGEGSVPHSENRKMDDMEQRDVGDNVVSATSHEFWGLQALGSWPSEMLIFIK